MLDFNRYKKHKNNLNKKKNITFTIKKSPD